MKNVTLVITVAAALVLGLSSANEARAWFGRGGSSGSSGSHGGFFSGNSHGSSGGSFGGLFGRHGSHGSNGSSGGSYSSGSDCGCGASDDDDAHGDNDHKSMNPPAAPRDPGSATQAPAGGGAAAIEPTPAIKGERVVVMATGASRPMRVLNR